MARTNTRISASWSIDSCLQFTEVVPRAPRPLTASDRIYPPASTHNPDSGWRFAQPRWRRTLDMTIADITLAVFTICNSVRVVAYVPQITKAATDAGGAKPSRSRRGAFSCSRMRPRGVRARQQGRLDDGLHVPGQCHRLRRDPPGRRLEALPPSPPASARDLRETASPRCHNLDGDDHERPLRIGPEPCPARCKLALAAIALAALPLGIGPVAGRRPGAGPGSRGRAGFRDVGAAGRRFAASPTSSWRRPRRATRRNRAHAQPRHRGQGRAGGRRALPGWRGAAVLRASSRSVARSVTVTRTAEVPGSSSTCTWCRRPASCAPS